MEFKMELARLAFLICPWMDRVEKKFCVYDLAIYCRSFDKEEGRYVIVVDTLEILEPLFILKEP